MMDYGNALFYTCSLIEYISRQKKIIQGTLSTLWEQIWNEYTIMKMFFHCEPIEKVSDVFIKRNNISIGNYDYISNCKYLIPSFYDIGKVFERLIVYCYGDGDDIFKVIREVYNS